MLWVYLHFKAFLSQYTYLDTKLIRLFIGFLSLEESRHLGLKLLNVLGTSFVSQLDVAKFIAKKGV
jgi:hypothetical protein